eukprot:1688278-Pyramimonas_sp.AAC.1
MAPLSVPGPCPSAPLLCFRKKSEGPCGPAPRPHHAGVCAASDLWLGQTSHADDLLPESENSWDMR